MNATDRTQRGDENFDELRHRLREGLRLFQDYLQQPEGQRAAGAQTLLDSAARAHQELNRLIEQVMAAYMAHRAEDEPTDPRILALQQTPAIASLAGVHNPGDIAARPESETSGLWIADASARYSAFVVAALTAQDALLDDTIEAEEYTRLLTETAGELAAAGASPKG